jgi:hypothetical protein
MYQTLPRNTQSRSRRWTTHFLHQTDAQVTTLPNYWEFTGNTFQPILQTNHFSKPIMLDKRLIYFIDDVPSSKRSRSSLSSYIPVYHNTSMAKPLQNPVVLESNVKQPLLDCSMPPGFVNQIRIS